MAKQLLDEDQIRGLVDEIVRVLVKRLGEGVAPKSSPKRYLSNSEAAAELGILPDTLDQWRYRRKGPRFYKIGSRVQYKLKDIDDWRENRLVDPDAH